VYEVGPSKEKINYSNLRECTPSLANITYLLVFAVQKKKKGYFVVIDYFNAKMS
jgi:hypothetical protein